ncbi:hypothetical protein BJY01DRAFT_241899 [Aspergillus pseudoustus]|uniref:Uncharacterized protein n=1 Tax=Aspergillus pseudoustus TaxID=1810923 RepID=A0ABR4L326_9EURO
MLRRLVSIASALSLGSIGLVAATDAFSADSLPSLAAIEPYTLNISCTECAFSYSECSENVHPDSYLSITFSTEDDTLLANGEVIFPASIPMKFDAQRHWDSSSEKVPVAYALEMQPLPHQPDADLGDLYVLKLSLVDLQGRPATERAVSVGIVRSTDGTVKLVRVEESTHHLYHHDLPGMGREHHRTGKGKGDSSSSSWGRVKTWKSYYITYLRGHSTSKSCASSVVDVPGQATDLRVVSHCQERQSLSGWTHDRHHYMKHVRPVLIPGLLGVAAGVVACVMGFVIGKLIVAVYVYFSGEVASAEPDDVEKLAAAAASADDECSAHDEKARLMEMYLERDSNPLSYPQ